MKKQNNGFKIGCIVLFLGMTVWYLFPTVQWMLEQRHIENLPAVERAEYLDDNRERLQNIRERSLSLGLDLQGGMYVTLEVGVPQLVQELAGDRIDDELEDIINVAADRSFEQNTNFITEFINEFEERDSNAMLSRYFRSDSHNITRRSENSEVETYLREQQVNAVERAMDIIRSRVDRYGVTEPSILQQGNSRLVVELPGVDDEERVRNLLRGTARLEFRLSADSDDLNNSKNRIIEYFESEEYREMAEEENGNPLLDVLNPQGRSN